MTESTEGQPEKSAVPGWYPDPKMVNTARYWDGAAWTEHRTPEAPLLRAAESGKRVKRLALVVGLCFLVPVLGVTFIEPSVAGESCGTWIMPEFTEAKILSRQIDSTLAGTGSVFSDARLLAIANECNSRLETRRLIALILMGAGLVARYGIPYVAKSGRGG